MNRSRFQFTNLGIGSPDKTYHQLMEQQIARQISNIKYEVEDLNLMVTEYYTTHWRDDESPESEYFASRSPLALAA